MTDQISLDKQLINKCCVGDYHFESVKKLLTTNIFTNDILRQSMNMSIYSMGEKTVNLLANYVEIPKLKVSNHFNDSQLKILNWNNPNGDSERLFALGIMVTDFFEKIQKISRKQKIKSLGETCL
jgi:hypothetical protein